MNELFLYVLCWMLLIFQGSFPRLDDDTYEIIGYVMVGVLVLFIVFNLLVIIWDGIIMHCIRHCKRRQAIIDFRMQRHKLSSLNKRALFGAKKLREWENNMKRKAAGLPPLNDEEAQGAALVR